VRYVLGGGGMWVMGRGERRVGMDGGAEMTDYQRAATDFRRFLNAACERQLGFGGMDWVARAEQVKAGIAKTYGLTDAEYTAVLRAEDEGLLIHAEVLG
jgi:hypothetical protein